MFCGGLSASETCLPACWLNRKRWSRRWRRLAHSWRKNSASAILAVLRLRNLRRIGDFLAKLEDVSVVVADGEFAHAVVKILDGINDRRFVFDLLPQGINIIGAEIKRACERGLLKGLMCVGNGDHYFDCVLPERCPAFHPVAHSNPSRSP